MQKKERVFLIIDGSNFYHRVKSFRFKKDLLEFDYSKFALWLVRHRTAVLKNYYIGVVRANTNDQKAQTLRKNQQRLFAKLALNKWKVARGYILRSGKEYHEKGVDVQMAVDILIGAYENMYDTIIVVSSDTDLIPALKKVRVMKKKIEYIGFSDKPSYALITHSDVRRLLTKEDMEQFF